MLVDIYDVGHGHCSVITAPNGRRMMLDCGTRWREGRFWTPSLHYFGQRLDLLALLNLDEDHLSDFGYMVKVVDWVLSNPTVGPREFTLLKEDGMQRGARAFAAWLASPKVPVISPLPDFGLVRIWWYCNRFVQGGTNNTNDLSLVVFAQYGGFKIMFAGDLEKAGWRRVLQDPAFRLLVSGTNIFVASHHGRDNGCCTDLFDLFRPEIVIISDAERQYDSQDTDDWYRQRCWGACLIADPSQRRYVMTTRNDGSMRVQVQPDGRWVLQPQMVADWPIDSAPSPELGDHSPGFGFGSDPFGSNALVRALTETAPPTPRWGLGALSQLGLGLDFDLATLLRRLDKST